MNYYYLQGPGLSVALAGAPLITALMGLITVSVGLLMGFYALRKWRESTWGWCDCHEDMTGKVVVVTGGNGGLGLETARGLAERGAVVVLACRDARKAREAILDIKTTTTTGDVVFLELELSQPESVQQFVKRLLAKFQHVDVLVNNAGVYFPSSTTPHTTDQGMEVHFAVNHLGHFLLTHLLTPALTAAPHARIVIVTSELYKGGRLELDGLASVRSSNTHTAPPTRGSRNPYYVNSKLANLLHARELHRRLCGRGVTVAAVSPGFVYTSLFRHSLQHFSWLKKFAFLPVAFLFMRSAKQGAQTSIHCACSAKVTNSSGGGLQYYQNCRPAALTAVAEDDGTARELWEASLQMLALKDIDS